MSYISDTGFNKRSRNILVADEGAIVPPDPPVALWSGRLAASDVSMNFSAVYVAFQPGAVGFGGLWLAGTAGDNVVISGGIDLQFFEPNETILAGNGVPEGFDPQITGPFYWEIQTAAPEMPDGYSEINVGAWIAPTVGYDANQLNGGLPSDSFNYVNFYNIDRTVGTTYGMVVYYDALQAPDPYRIAFFLNGVFINDLSLPTFNSTLYRPFVSVGVST